MLKGKLYRIKTIDLLQPSYEGNPVRKYSAILALDSSHQIFEGHFPGNPVLPGVCQVEIVRELAEEILGLKLLLSQASQVKYLNIINPSVNPLLNLDLKFGEPVQGEFDVSAEVTSAGSVFMKMKCRFKEFNS